MTYSRLGGSGAPHRHCAGRRRRHPGGPVVLGATILGEALSVLGSVLSSGADFLADWLGGLWEGVLDALLRDWLVGIGADMVRGLLDGLASMAGDIAETMLGPVADLADGVREALGIHSPSRVIADTGEATGADLAVAIAASPAPAYTAPTAPGEGLAAAFRNTAPDAPTVRGGEGWDADDVRRVRRWAERLHRDLAAAWA